MISVDFIATGIAKYEKEPLSAYQDWFINDDNAFYCASDPTIGYEVIPSFYGQHCEGGSTRAIGKYTHAEGRRTTAGERYAHAEGDGSKAYGQASHAEGFETKASGKYGHSEGYQSTASGSTSHAEGYQTTASGSHSHSEGQLTKAMGKFSHAQGYKSTALSDYSFAAGNCVSACGNNSIAFGYKCEISSSNGFIWNGKSTKYTVEFPAEIFSDIVKVDNDFSFQTESYSAHILQNVLQVYLTIFLCQTRNYKLLQCR